MATRLQKLLQAPLLLDIVTRSRRIDLSRGGDMPDVIKCLRSPCLRFNVPVETDFKNEIQWAKKQLLSNGDVIDQPRIWWDVSDQGLKRLHVLSDLVLRKLPPARLVEFWGRKTENEVEWGIAVIKLVPLDSPNDILAARSCSTCCELFSEAFSLIPAESLTSILTSMYEILLDLFFEYSTALEPFAVT
jgi:hypothetical protein